MSVDFDRTVSDYARYRTEFPSELFRRLAMRGIGVAGQRIVDIGTGTGVLARAFASAGCTVTGVDVAAELLAEARRQSEGLPVTYEVATAEDTGLPGGEWDAVSAAQCWHWFDGQRAAAEVRRLLRPGGSVVLCTRDYLVLPGNVCAVSEDLILRHNPGWHMAGGYGMHPQWAVDLGEGGFTDLETFSFDIVVPHTHEAWRGRMRSSNGVGASLSSEQVQAFDDELTAILTERFPDEPLLVPHRVWALTGRRGD